MARHTGVRIRSVAILQIVTTAMPVQAKSQVEARYSADYEQCLAAAKGVTGDLMICNGAETDRQDPRLNQTCKLVLAWLSLSRKSSLRTSERAWITERDRRCRCVLATETGGALATVIQSGCILDETIKRLIWLEPHKG
jgi:uncharacterized protein YecT (DUF1311 family)